MKSAEFPHGPILRTAEMAFDSQGNLTHFSGPNRLQSYNGRFNVAESGAVTGAITYQSGYDPEQGCPGEVGTSVISMQGSFVSKNRAEGTFTTSDTSTCETEPPKITSGTWTMTR